MAPLVVTCVYMSSTRDVTLRAPIAQSRALRRRQSASIATGLTPLGQQIAFLASMLQSPKNKAPGAIDERAEKAATHANDQNAPRSSDKKARSWASRICGSKTEKARCSATWGEGPKVPMGKGPPTLGLIPSKKGDGWKGRADGYGYEEANKRHR